MYEQVDRLPYTWKYRSTTELGQHLAAKKCEWCGTQEGLIEVHHVRKLKDLQGKTDWKIPAILNMEMEEGRPLK